jgi:hypothetical protein
VIFDIRCAFRGRAQAELDSSEPGRFVELACGMVFLVRVHLRSVRAQCLGKEDETCPPTFAPLGRVDIHPVNVRIGHRQKGNDRFVARADPDVTARSNHFSEDRSGPLQCKRLPVGRNRYATTS